LLVKRRFQKAKMDCVKIYEEALRNKRPNARISTT